MDGINGRVERVDRVEVDEIDDRVERVDRVEVGGLDRLRRMGGSDRDGMNRYKNFLHVLHG